MKHAELGTSLRSGKTLVKVPGWRKVMKQCVQSLVKLLARQAVKSHFRPENQGVQAVQEKRSNRVVQPLLGKD